MVGPPTDKADEVSNIASVLELLKGTFALWLYNTNSNNIYVARQGSTLFHKGTNVSSIKGTGYKEVSEGIIYEYTNKGLEAVDGFVSDSPFLTL
jgi:glucosamine 6-phosphate synthetase-like amidotransferase/phosphosugar isomerase protein